MLLSFGMSSDGTVPVLDRTRTDAKGAFRFAIPSRKTRQGLGRFADIWAYRPGLALGAESEYLLEGFESEPLQIVLRPAGKRAVTVLDAGGKPLVGARTEIRSIHFPSAHTNMANEFLPDELAARLAVMTGKDGKAEFPWIGDRDQFVSSRVTVAGLGSYDFQVAGRLSASGQDDTSHLTMTIKAGGRLLGTILDDELGSPWRMSRSRSGPRERAGLRPHRCSIPAAQYARRPTVHSRLLLRFSKARSIAWSSTLRERSRHSHAGSRSISQQGEYSLWCSGRFVPSQDASWTGRAKRFPESGSFNPEMVQNARRQRPMQRGVSCWVVFARALPSCLPGRKDSDSMGR